MTTADYKSGAVISKRQWMTNLVRSNTATLPLSSACFARTHASQPSQNTAVASLPKAVWVLFAENSQPVTLLSLSVCFRGISCWFLLPLLASVFLFSRLMNTEIINTDSRACMCLSRRICIYQHPTIVIKLSRSCCCGRLKLMNTKDAKRYIYSHF